MPQSSTLISKVQNLLTNIIREISGNEIKKISLQPTPSPSAKSKTSKNRSPKLIYKVFTNLLPKPYFTVRSDGILSNKHQVQVGVPQGWALSAAYVKQ